jgi:hypothetical protein
VGEGRRIERVALADQVHAKVRGRLQEQQALPQRLRQRETRARRGGQVVHREELEADAEAQAARPVRPATQERLARRFDREADLAVAQQLALPGNLCRDARGQTRRVEQRDRRRARAPREQGLAKAVDADADRAHDAHPGHGHAPLHAAPHALLASMPSLVLA